MLYLLFTIKNFSFEYFITSNILIELYNLNIPILVIKNANFGVFWDIQSYSCK